MPKLFNILIIWFLILPHSVQGGDFVSSGYTEAGKRSTAEDYDEEDTDDDYTYNSYHLKLEQEASDRLSYDAGFFIYDKDYASKDSLDNISRLFKTNWSYYLRKLKGESLEIALKLNYKEKRYAHSPKREYDQIRAAPALTFKRDGLYGVDLTAGIDNYDYLEKGVKEQFKVFGSIGLDRYFLEKKLMLTSSCKIEQIGQKSVDRKRTKDEVMGGVDYVFALPWLHKITFRVMRGERDTKEEDARDEDADFEYWRYYAKTEHRLNPRLKTDLKYQYFKKDYIGADLDHRGFYIRTIWDYEILEDESRRLWLDFALEHKDADYTMATDNDYRKETLETALNYRRKKNWKVSAAIEGNFYDFNASGNDKDRYYARVSGEKLFLDGDLALSLDVKYRYTAYRQKEDKGQEAVRAAFKYRF